ncbi:hypothetical protein SAY87_005358 [Trapa incisa]|uniref:TPX2 C-terminal domain-containing protein n=1 Tax=Trapa incisa TaxID=236973 RepID=A0AAN7KCB4_9MYRT|nr:hypothetical protein SAY87_005358 [Trapa incisa]
MLRSSVHGVLSEVHSSFPGWLEAFGGISMDIPPGVFRSPEKMGEAQAALATRVGLEASLSFSRLETNTLSRENSSCFSPNKYLQEVEKCATPGSVAQKKAYFEAHHKNFNAAWKMEMSNDQEKQVAAFGRIRLACDDSGNSIADGDGAGCLTETDLPEIPYSGEKAIEDEDRSGEICNITDGLKEGTEENKPGRYLEQNDSEGNSLREEEVEEVPMGSPEVPEEPKKDSKTKPCISPMISNGHCKLGLQKKSPKVCFEDRSAARKLPGGSTMTRPTASKSPIGSGSMTSLNRSKSSSSEREQKKTVFPRSLHMSMRLEGSQKTATPSNSVTQMRKSLTMERMGDKDNAKRMLRSFDNTVGHPKSSVEGRSRLHRPAPSVAVDPKASPSAARRASPSAGTRSFGSGCSNEREGKRNEFLQKKLEGKSTKKVEGIRSQLKSRDEKDATIEKQRKNLNFKATPLPSFYQGVGKEKSSMRQEGYKSEIYE